MLVRNKIVKNKSKEYFDHLDKEEIRVLLKKDRFDFIKNKLSGLIKEGKRQRNRIAGRLCNLFKDI